MQHLIFCHDRQYGGLGIQFVITPNDVFEATGELVAHTALLPEGFRPSQSSRWKYVPPYGTAPEYGVQQGVIELIAAGVKYSEALDQYVNGTT